MLHSSTEPETSATGTCGETSPRAENPPRRALTQEERDTLFLLAARLVQKTLVQVWPLWRPVVEARPAGQVPLLRIEYDLHNRLVHVDVRCVPRDELPEVAERGGDRASLLASLDQAEAMGDLGIVSLVELGTDAYGLSSAWVTSQPKKQERVHA